MVGKISLLAPTDCDLDALVFANDNIMRSRLIPRNEIRNQGIVNNLGHQEGKTV